MRGTQIRVNRVLKNAEIMRKKRLDMWLSQMYILTFCFLALDIMAISYLSGAGMYHSGERWLYGATILFSNAGGYVLVAVIAFVIAVAITILCIKSTRK